MWFNFHPFVDILQEFVIIIIIIVYYYYYHCHYYHHCHHNHCYQLPLKLGLSLVCLVVVISQFMWKRVSLLSQRAPHSLTRVN